MVKVTVEKDGEKNVFTGESVIGMTMTKEDLDDNKVAYAGNRFGMIDMDGEYLPELLVELINNLDDNKVAYAGNRFGMIDMDGEYLPELLVELINNLFKEVHETPVEYLHAMVQTSNLLNETTMSAVTENADALANTLRAVLKGEEV